MEKNYWHPAFCGATEWELKQNKNDLIFDSEHQLSKKPLQMDMLVIKKNPAVVIQNEIGKLFKQHNVVEFKGSGDDLSIDDYYKTIGYACLYKSLGKHVNEIPAEEITLTMIREAYPKELIRMLEDSGVMIEEKFPGIYYLSGSTTFDAQIIVTRDLDSDKHAGLKILSKNAREQDVRKFLEEAKLAKEPGDLQNIDAVLQVSVSANKELYEEVRRDENMCQALRELMKDEIAEERAEERVAATAEATDKRALYDIKKMMKNLKMSAMQAMQTLEIPEADQARYSAML